MIKKVNNNFDGLNIVNLKDVLKSLKLYKDLSLKLGERGKRLFSSINSGKSIYRVEYFDGISKDEAIREAILAYKKAFNDSPSQDDIILENKKSLDGGIRIYKDDSMVDLSFKRVENILI